MNLPRRLRAAWSSRAPALAVAGLVLHGCANVPPWLERSYARVGPAVIVETVEVGDRSSDGPYPGVGAAVGTLLAIEGTRAVGLEAGVVAFDLDRGELDGFGFRAYAGPRWQWNMDGRVRPTVGVGASWSELRDRDAGSHTDPSGLGIWADLGVDWMITPRFGLGAKVRDNVRYEDTSANRGLRQGLEFALETVWRF